MIWTPGWRSRHAFSVAVADVSVDEALLRDVRELAGQYGVSVSALIEAAVRAFIGRGGLPGEGVSDLDEEQALRLAYDELHEMRRERRLSS